jgi:hypothetical protein
MITSNLASWAVVSLRRKIVLQAVCCHEGKWRAEAIDEHGSTVGMQFADEPDQAVRNLVLETGEKKP